MVSLVVWWRERKARRAELDRCVSRHPSGKLTREQAEVLFTVTLEAAREDMRRRRRGGA